ncbi:TIGR02117 family protein [Bergeyella sp. RCAD1439]|uniref:TIGR02117 family protein n=1 Tax=Bergeyella anatis TaxID=3113737 RepID=UPI002E16F60B|nr:TIGR02117 family protein [Bergeyella sp. RCAD1439]
MRRLFFIVIKGIGGLLGLVLLYVFLGYFVPFLPVQAEATPEPKVVKGFIMTNGVHTDIVMPVVSEQVDWSERFPYENLRSGASDYRYIAIGWGDKGFYLDTPTWAELKPSTALKAAFWLGDAAVHATYYKSVQEGEDVRAFTMTERQYRQLIEFIDGSMEKRDQRYIPIKTEAVYGDNDAFYEAKGSYSFLHTCNTWANNALKAAGQKAALWTPTDFGLFRHYEKK